MHFPYSQNQIISNKAKKKNFVYQTIHLLYSLSLEEKRPSDAYAIAYRDLKMLDVECTTSTITTTQLYRVKQIVLRKRLVISDNNRPHSLETQKFQPKINSDSSPENVLILLCFCFRADPLFVVMEYAKLGKLQSVLRNSRGINYYTNTHGPSSLTSQELIMFCYQIAKGMDFLSSKGVRVH